MDRIAHAIRTLATEVSADRVEFRRAIGQGADDLLDGLMAHGYAMRQGDRYAVSPAGFRRLEATDGTPDDITAEEMHG